MTKKAKTLFNIIRDTLPEEYRGIRRMEFFSPELRKDKRFLGAIKKYKGIDSSRAIGSTLSSIIEGHDSQRKLVEHLGMSQSLISERLYLLEKMDYIKTHDKDLREKYYSVNWDTLVINCFTHFYPNILPSDSENNIVPRKYLKYFNKKSKEEGAITREEYFDRLFDSYWDGSLKFVRLLMLTYFQTIKPSAFAWYVHVGGTSNINETLFERMVWSKKGVDMQKLFLEQEQLRKGKFYPTINEFIISFAYFLMNNYEQIKAMTHTKENLKRLEELLENGKIYAAHVKLTAEFKNAFKQLNL